MTKYSPTRLRKLSQLRAQIEAFAAREAAAQRADADSRFTDLKDALLQLNSAVRRSDYEAFLAADTRLHGLIVQMAEVPLLEEIWQTVWGGLAEFHNQAFKEYFPDLRTLAQEHEYLVEAITYRDPNAAEDAARSHVEAVWLRVAEQKSLPPPVSDPLQRAVAYLAFRFHAPLLLREVAMDVAFTSPGNLSRLFRIHYGVSFQAYLQNLRLAKAAELLIQTRMPVASICRRVGYNDLSRFGQHFKRCFGRTPTAWRSTQMISQPLRGAKFPRVASPTAAGSRPSASG